MKNKFGFTLAEVLITLVIIGVVAALTIPTAISNHRKNETAAKLKQTFSILSQGLKNATVEYGDFPLWNFYNGTVGGSNIASDVAQYNKIFLDKYMVPYLKNIQNSGIQNLKTMGYNDGLYNPDGTQYVNQWYDFNFIKLPNGVYVLGSSNFDGTTKIIGLPLLYIDVNGSKSPNEFGKDIFLFLIDKRKGLSIMEDVSPYGENFGSCKRSCIYYIVKNNWEFPKNYPYNL